MEIIQGVSFFKYENPPIKGNEIYTILYIMRLINECGGELYSDE